MSPASILIFSPPPLQDSSLPPVGHIQGPVGPVSYHPGGFLMFFLLTWRTHILISAWFDSSALSSRTQLKLPSLTFLCLSQARSISLFLRAIVLIIHTHLAIIKIATQYLCFFICISNPGSNLKFEQTLGDSEGQGSLVWCHPWGHRVRYDLATEQPPQVLRSLKAEVTGHSSFFLAWPYFHIYLPSICHMRAEGTVVNQQRSLIHCNPWLSTLFFLLWISLFSFCRS